MEVGDYAVILSLQMRAVKEAEAKADKELDVLMSDFSGLIDDH